MAKFGFSFNREESESMDFSIVKRHIMPIPKKRYKEYEVSGRNGKVYEDLGTYEDIEILGFRGQFTMLYGNNENNYFAKAEMGIGINEQTKLEGIHKNNFLATYIIGPILILNPYFTLKLLKMMGVENPKLAFEKEVIEAYNIRLKKFKELQSKN